MKHLNGPIALVVACAAFKAVAGPCERPLLVPVAHAGASVSVQGQQVSGVFPEVLRLAGKRLQCPLEFPIVPRARVARVFLEEGGSDILAPATRTRERDAKGQFVPLVRSLTMLVSLRSRAIDLPTVDALLKDAGKVVVLRAYSWGDEYERLIAQMEEQGRVQYVADTERVIERLRNGLADYSLIPPSLFLSILQEGQARRDWSADDFQQNPLMGLPTAQIGLYLSRDRLSVESRTAWANTIGEAVRDGTVLRLYQAAIPVQWLRDYVRIDSEAPQMAQRSGKNQKAPLTTSEGL